ncbi:hypothetical protein CMI45_03220, partial [Candidatus Pacearchaeota archaeon]|nr:hypothetical protein [Candidatus Pacearchaeota archaeon]
NGDYDYFIRCVDAGGNSAEVVTEFTVFVDIVAPAVTRAYRDLDALKIVTNEDAECVYSLNDCNYVFDEGLSLLYSNPEIKESHFAEWKNNAIYHVKCRDEKGNEPSPNECSLVVSAVDII